MPVAAAPRGLTDADPVRSLITGAPKAITFHKGFQEIYGMAVFLYPVRTDTPGDSAQNVAGQVRNFDPGQNQKPHVVGHEFEIDLPCLHIPADKVIPGSASYSLPLCCGNPGNGIGQAGIERDPEDQRPQPSGRLLVQGRSESRQ